MKIFNTMSRKKEEFVPIEKNKVKIYACGPTVYNLIHIGNARPICVCDVLRRYLEYKGLEVTFVQNFTDIDDKIIKKANEENSDYLTVSQKYIKEYKIDAKGLNIREATIHPKATENIDEIIRMVETLINKGFAYVTANGDVYFRTKRFNDYGKLSQQPLDDLEAGARISIDDIKEDPMDFALWKAAKSNEPYWKAPWGKGRPGWHIECSVMANKYLGKTIDIHYGGQDLIFPHHENEIAQSECCNGAVFANYWMHNGYINIDNKKMSKSLNNFFTVREIAEKYGYEPIRYLMLSSHYRSPINYSEDIIKQCVAALDRLYTCKKNLEFLLKSLSHEENRAEVSVSTKTFALQEIELGSDISLGDNLKNLKTSEASNISIGEILDSQKDDVGNPCCAGGNFEGLDEAFKIKLLAHRTAFLEAMDDDLNTADAITAVFELVRDINVSLNNSAKVFQIEVEFALNLFNELTGILGLVYVTENNSLEKEIEALIEKRQQARKNKDFKTADQIREELKSRRILLEDTPNGVKWKKI